MCRHTYERSTCKRCHTELTLTKPDSSYFCEPCEYDRNLAALSRGSVTIPHDEPMRSLFQSVLFAFSVFAFAFAFHLNTAFAFETGKASWYSSSDACQFNVDPKCPMANGRSLYDAESKRELFCASWRHKLGTRLRVTNLENNKSAEVVVMDRGPARRLGRVADLGRRAFSQIADIKEGVINVRLETI